MSAAKSSERRDGPRIDLRLRVRYEAAGVTGAAEASDISPRGLRLESEIPVEKGTRLTLQVDGGDAGEAEELAATGLVTWCRPHTSPTGKTLYDLGVSFESDWLARDRTQLGVALARIFAMNSYEPARNFERTAVSLVASVTSPAVQLHVGNLSVGGMQLRSQTPLGAPLTAGAKLGVQVEVGGVTHVLAGKVAWVAGAREAAPAATGPDAFGVEFGDLTEADRRVLDAVRTGAAVPERITVTLES